MTSTQASKHLGRLIEEVHRGAPVILIHKNKLVKLERYEPLDPDFDSQELETALLQAVLGPHSAYSRQDLEAAATRVRRKMRKKSSRRCATP
jgi:hypothetical protein